MSIDIIVRGEPLEIDFVRRICRDKIRRGMLAILPASVPADDEVVKLRNERDETKAENERLKERMRELESKYVEAEDLQEVDIDTDDKTLHHEDTKDVSGEDAKEVPTEDAKGVPADDAKEEDTSKKKSKRSKKQE